MVAGQRVLLTIIGDGVAVAYDLDDRFFFRCPVVDIQRTRFLA